MLISVAASSYVLRSPGGTRDRAQSSARQAQLRSCAEWQSSHGAAAARNAPNVIVPNARRDTRRSLSPSCAVCSAHVRTLCRGPPRRSSLPHSGACSGAATRIAHGAADAFSARADVSFICSVPSRNGAAACPSAGLRAAFAPLPRDAEMSAAFRGPQHGGSGWVSEEGRAHSRRSAYAESHGEGEAAADEDSHKYRGDKPQRLDAISTAPGRVSDRQARPFPRRMHALPHVVSPAPAPRARRARAR